MSTGESLPTDALLFPADQGSFQLDVSGPADVTSPEITAVDPAEGATDVATDTNIEVTFSEPMNQASAEGAFSLVRESDAAAVSGSFSWQDSTMTFDPADELDHATEYAAEVTTDAQDEAGNPLAAKDAAGNVDLTPAKKKFRVIKRSTKRRRSGARRR